MARFRGSLVGAIVGDCLGAYFEGDMEVPMAKALQHFSAVNTFPRKKEGNGLFCQLSRLSERRIWKICVFDQTHCAFNETRCAFGHLHKPNANHNLTLTL